MRYANLGAGRRAAYTVIGSGEPLLYFTGGPGENAAVLQGDAEMLADRFAVYLIEPHGSGGSTPPAELSLYDPPGHARFYEEAHRALGVGAATIMGFSFGATVALSYAALFPEVTTRCVAIAGRAVGAEAGEDADVEMERNLARHTDASWYQSARKTWDQWTERVLATSDPRELDAMMVQVLPFYMANPELPAVQARIDVWRRDLRTNLAAAQAWERGLWESLDIRSLLREIASPTLVLVGEQDMICGPTHGELIACLVQGSEMVVIPDCGHFIPIEAPDTFRGALLSFCDNHPVIPTL
jgi:proline iminopeptidase